MSAVLLWGPESCSDPIFPLFKSRQGAQSFLGADREVVAYLDDLGVAFPPAGVRQKLDTDKADLVTLNFLSNALTKVDAKLFENAAASLDRHPNWILIASRSRMHSQQFRDLDEAFDLLRVLNVTSYDDALNDEDLLRFHPAAGRLLISLVAYEGMQTGRSALQPESLDLPGQPLPYVTSGWNAGTSFHVQTQELYWRRFLAWLDTQNKSDGKATLIDLSYVDFLAQAAGLVGFCKALSNYKDSGIE